MEVTSTETEFTIDTIISGTVSVEIEGIGEFKVAAERFSLGAFAAQAYSCLTGGVNLTTNKNFAEYFELISVNTKDPTIFKAVFRLEQEAKIIPIPTRL